MTRPRSGRPYPGNKYPGLAVADDGTHKSKEELIKLYGEKGVNGSEGSHRLPDRRAFVPPVALKYILGLENVRNYDRGPNGAT
jgi:hypothetical protein